MATSKTLASSKYKGKLLKRKIIISCTTTNERLKFLHYTLISIKKQSLKPDIVYVNISKEPYLLDEGVKDLPVWLEELDVIINWVENTGSFRKLLPVFQKYTVEDQDLVVTIDDDILYGENWLEDLVFYSDKNRGSLVCARGRKMKKNIFGRWQNYSNWVLFKKETKGLNILPTGGAGVVYKKPLIDVDFLLDNTFKKIAPTSDDLWFKMASYRKKTPVIVCPKINTHNTYLRHKLGLDQLNLKIKSYSVRLYKNTFGFILNWFGVNITKNDKCWDAICDYSKKKTSK